MSAAQPFNFTSAQHLLYPSAHKGERSVDINREQYSQLCRHLDTLGRVGVSLDNMADGMELFVEAIGLEDGFDDWNVKVLKGLLLPIVYTLRSYSAQLAAATTEPDA
jgi:hypothetical protein